MDPWFLDNLRQLVEFESVHRARVRRAQHPAGRDAARGQAHGVLRHAASAALTGKSEQEIRSIAQGGRGRARPTSSSTPAPRSSSPSPPTTTRPTSRRTSPARPTGRKVDHPGRRAQPHRPGHRVRLLLRARHPARCEELGIEAIMVNCNPETVSTDYDTSDKLYFEPLTYEDVLNVIELEKPDGVIVQFGGQTPLKLALPLEKAGVPILGHLAGLDRPRRGPRPLRRAAGHARHRAARSTPRPPRSRRRSRSPSRSAIPLLVRPSYVLGGRAMEIVYDMGSLENYMQRGGQGLRGAPGPARPLPGGRLRVRRGRHLATASAPRSAGSCSTSRRRASTPGDSMARAAALPAQPRAARRHRRDHPDHRRRTSRSRASSTSSSRSSTTRSTSSR
ncbi:MAG: hypothetical protein MZV70_50015 [Desulfobacterales bacterium]|nr:hypothetical protein [Desulfobacterales bacterium]